MEISLLLDPELIGMDSDRANQVASQISDGEFSSRFDQLEAMLGFDVAREVVKNGKVLTYKNGKLREYWTQASEVRAKLNDNSIPAKPFYSLESLADFMKSGIDFTGFESHNYKLLSNMASSRMYLDQLVDEGEVTVGGFDRWTESHRPTGARGGSILKKIASQLLVIFKDLNLDAPETRIEFGQAKIVLGKESQEYLGQIRNYIDGKK